MNIFYDYQVFLSQKFGGPSRYFIELSKNINQLNCKSIIYSPFFINKYLKDENNKNVEKKIFLPKKAKLNFFFNYINTKLTKKYLKSKKFDILHPTYYDIKKYSDLKIPKVLTVYDLIHERFPEYYGLPKNHKIKNEALKLASHFLCPSYATKKDLIEIYNIDESKISVIYWAPFRKDHNINFQKVSDKPFLLFVGNRHKYKNAYKFLEAFSYNKYLNKNLKIIFFGGGIFNSYEKNIINQLNLKNKVELVIGSDDKLINLYKNAKAMIYPSKYEGLGLPILEAMNYGCPVATSYTSGMIEAGGNAVEYFDPDDIESISSSIEKLLDSEDYLKKLVGLGYDHVKKFTWPLCAKQTFEIYRKLI